MPKTATDPLRLQGRSMGTLWRVTVDGAVDDPAALQDACQATVDLVDRQMSTWTADSDLMRLNAAPVGDWIDLPPELICVLEAGIKVSRMTDGAFEMNVGDAVRAWGFTGGQADLAAIRAASSQRRLSAVVALEMDVTRNRARKTAPLALDLSGIAKGYAVDRLADLLSARGVGPALCEIDGELRATGPRRDGGPWAVAVQDPDGAGGADAGQAGFALDYGAIATSGDYRHFVTVRGKRLSHTMDPQRGAPLLDGPASVTVLAPTCMMADAMATALMVMGAQRGADFARAQGIRALILSPRPADAPQP